VISVTATIDFCSPRWQKT